MIFDNLIVVRTWSRSTGSMPNSPNSTDSWFPIWCKHITSPKVENNEWMNESRLTVSVRWKLVYWWKCREATCSFPCTSWPDIKPRIFLKLEMVVLTFHLKEAIALLEWMIICLMIVVILSFLHTTVCVAVFWSCLPQYRWKFGQRMCCRATSLQAWGRKGRDGRGQRERLKQFYIFAGKLLSFTSSKS